MAETLSAGVCENTEKIEIFLNPNPVPFDPNEPMTFETLGGGATAELPPVADPTAEEPNRVKLHVMAPVGATVGPCSVRLKGDKTAGATVNYIDLDVTFDVVAADTQTFGASVGNRVPR